MFYQGRRGWPRRAFRDAVFPKSFGQPTLAVVLVPAFGNIVSLECFSRKWRLRRVDRHEKIGGCGVSQLIGFEKFREVVVRDRPGHGSEFDFLWLLEQIEAVTVRNHRDVRGAIR